MSRKLVLGIDTGGTYTDGVLLDYASREVIAATKTLTTRQDLRRCILQALDDLLPDDPGQVQLVAISTTLATNAIAEGKGRPVALFLLGYDADLVRRFRFDGRFATPRIEYFQGGHDLYGQAQAPLDLAAVRDRAQALAGEVEAVAVSGYFSPFNAAHEEAAYQAITAVTDLPVVLGYQLSSRLDSIQRATTASLNASLLSILREFLQAMRQALDERGLTAPLMVMRGDGTLVSTASSAQRPVETVHSGPAASAVGGRFLAREPQALVIDIGGTTTDLAVIDQAQVTISETGTAVGPYRTAIRAANVRSIGLGGDSVIGFDVEDNLMIGPERVTPIAYLAHQYPLVAQDVRRLSRQMAQGLSPDEVEFWFLQREPARFLENDRARRVVTLLRERPLPLPRLLDLLGVFHPLQFGGQALVDEEIVGRAALTPTDLLHVTGEYAPWDGEAATIAASVIARQRQWSVIELNRRVRQRMAQMIAAEVVTFLSGHTLDYDPDHRPGDLGSWAFAETVNGRHVHLGAKLWLKLPIIGIGAPAGIFLPLVAELLDTALILPPHYRVANAVGAVVGSVMAVQEAWIVPQTHKLKLRGYYVQVGGERRRFTQLEAALAYAQQASGDLALAAAQASGAIDPQVSWQRLPDGADSYRIRASAIGGPPLGKRVNE